MAFLLETELLAGVRFRSARVRAAVYLATRGARRRSIRVGGDKLLRSTLAGTREHN